MMSQCPVTNHSGARGKPHTYKLRWPMAPQEHTKSQTHHLQLSSECIRCDSGCEGRNREMSENTDPDHDTNRGQLLVLLSQTLTLDPDVNKQFWLATSSAGPDLLLGLGWSNDFPRRLFPWYLSNGGNILCMAFRRISVSPSKTENEKHLGLDT